MLTFSPFRRAVAVIICHLIEMAFVVALWSLYDPFAAVLAVGAIIANRYAIHCWLSKFGISLR